MRQGGPNNSRRSRGRHHGGSGMGGGNGGPSPSGQMRDGNPSGNMGNNRPRSAASLRHQTFDSNGPDVRVRGNAWQVYDKYLSLARDATSSGDRVAAENYQQHAEHYYRIIEAINEATAAEQYVRPQFTNQQPDVPANYYAPDGSLMPSGNPTPLVVVDSNGNGEPTTKMAEAEVQSKNPPPAPFFTPEEAEETSEPQSLVAQR